MRDCVWHINPGMGLDTIEFGTESAEFYHTDHLSFFSSMRRYTSGGSAIFQASAKNPLKEQFAVGGTNEVVLVLSAMSASTHFTLAYSCRPFAHRFGSLYILGALIASGIVLCLLAVYMLHYCRAKHYQEITLHSSRLILHSELAQQQEEIERSLYEEQRTLGALHALPRKQWHAAVLSETRLDKSVSQEPELCCLCLDPFDNNDEIRLLPCQHYYHTGCIDNWFAARRFLPRSCPQCRRNPLADAPLCAVSAIAVDEAVVGSIVAAGSSVGAERRQRMFNNSEAHRSSPSQEVPHQPEARILGRAQIPVSTDPRIVVTSSAPVDGMIPRLPGAVMEDSATS